MRVRASLGLGGCFLIVHVLFLLAMPATTSASSYPDVAVDHPYYAAIDDLSDRGVISGFIDGTFGPNAPITRQQFAKMIVLALGLEPVAGDQCQFVDVDAGWPYPRGFVATAAAHGITYGRDALHFAPYANISGYQVLSMVVRAANQLFPGCLRELLPLFDAPGSAYGGPPHGDNVSLAVANGLIDFSQGGFPGSEAMSRAQVAYVLHNLLLLVDPPVEDAWMARYYRFAPLQSQQPLAIESVPAIDFDWSETSPDPCVSVENFQVLWTRSIELLAGTYRFRSQTDGEMMLWVDGKPVIDQAHDFAYPQWAASAWVSLPDGRHFLRCSYRHRTYWNATSPTRVWWERKQSHESLRDQPDLLSSPCELELTNLWASILQKLNLDVVVRTMAATTGTSAQKCAEDTLRDLSVTGEAKGRVVVVIPDERRPCGIAYSGTGFPDLTVAAIARIRDTYVQPLVSAGDYDGAAKEAYVRLMEEALFPHTVRLLVLNYDPKVPSHGNRCLHELSPFWRDPHELVSDYVAGLNSTTGGTVTYAVAEWRDIDGFFPLTDGFRYTADKYIDIYEDWVDAHGGDWYGYWQSAAWHDAPTGSADYGAIMKENDLIAGVNERLYDEVLLLCPPMTGCFESQMIGPSAILCNSPPIMNSEAEREFVIMTVGWEREVGCGLEAFGHRCESILSHVFAHTPHALTGKNYWEMFTRYDKVAPGQSACGMVHWAPNSDSDYDWGNTRYVPSTCDDWLNFPHLSGKTSQVNCTEWGNGDMAGHHLWWFSHFPQAASLDADGMLLNWWGYVSVFLTGY